MNACDIDLAAHRLLSEDQKNRNRIDHVDAVVDRKKRLIALVVFGYMREVRDHIDERRNCWSAISNFNLLNRCSNISIVRSRYQDCKLQ